MFITFTNMDGEEFCVPREDIKWLKCNSGVKSSIYVSSLATCHQAIPQKEYIRIRHILVDAPKPITKTPTPISGN